MLIKETFRMYGVTFSMFAMLVMVISISMPGCSENPTASKEVVDTVEEPNQPGESLDPEIQALITKSERYEQWITTMDPFVTENTDGTYLFDNEGFSRTNPVTLAGDDLTIVNELKEGIPIVNQKIIDERKHQGATALGGACWWYWWGQRCCFWGSTARHYIMVLAMGGPIPVFGWGYAVFASWATYLTSVYGGFCFNRSWAGGVWLTAP